MADIRDLISPVIVRQGNAQAQNNLSEGASFSAAQLDLDRACVALCRFVALELAAATDKSQPESAMAPEAPPCPICKGVIQPAREVGSLCRLLPKQGPI
jgi:hypothetical protein